VRRCSTVGLGLAGGIALAVAAATFGRTTLLQALSDLGRVQPGWLLLAGLGFATSLICSAAAWNVGLRVCGGRSTTTDVAARYATGSLVNSVTPAHVGGAVRIGLLARTLPGSDAVLRTCGIGAAVAAARALVLAVLVLGAAAVGRVPLWPAPIVVLVVLAALAVGTRLSTHVAGRVGAALQLFRSPRAGVGIGGWIACSFAARLGATVAIVAALGIPRPLTVAVVLLAAVALAGLLPLTPGNFGAGAGAAVLALHGTGVGGGVALALGMTFQAVETCTAFVLGVGGTAVLAAPGTPVRRLSLATVGLACMAIAALVGVVSVDLV
jgi:uncharacterized membrane protein YbhN (UPF0104 family)